MANKGRSERGLLGNIIHYDENGKMIGYSEPGMSGSYTHYDTNGKRTGQGIAFSRCPHITDTGFRNSAKKRTLPENRKYVFTFGATSEGELNN